MMLSNPVLDFFSRAVIHARKQSVTELNLLEAELIMAEDKIIELKRNSSASSQIVSELESRISTLKQAVKNKKKEF